MMQDEIYSLWKEYTEGKAVDLSRLSDHVVTSWELGKAHNIDPRGSLFVEVLSSFELQFHMEKNKELLEAAQNIFEMIEISTRSQASIILLTSKDGIILNVGGDTSALGDMEVNYNIQGCKCSVAHMGARATTLCMQLNKPISLCGVEHYCRAFHNSSCYAAPIHAPDGKVIGSIGVSGLKPEWHPHTLALVATSAQAIDLRLREKKAYKAEQNVSQLLDSVCNSFPEGILVLDPSGNVSHANDNCLSLLNMDLQELVGKNVLDLVSKDSRKLFTSHLQKHQHASCDIIFENTNQENSCLCRFNPLRDKKDNMTGTSIVITSRSQLRDLTTHLGGHHAVYNFHHIIGISGNIRENVALATKIAPTQSRVLIVGESGTGKELFAQSIHNNSLVHQGPFVAISCGAIPRDLIEAELFGYVGGAFTGANKNGAIGKFELASGGTLFLDEVNSLPFDMQAKLLRAIQQGEITKLGDNKVIKVNTRIIAASNKNLKQAVEENTFRGDLYYRLNVVEINVAPLRHRQEDIVLLAKYFIAKISKEYQFRKLLVDQNFYNALNSYSWPGNVRELYNICERAVILSDGIKLDAGVLPQILQEGKAEKDEELQVSTVKNAFWYVFEKSMRENNNNISLVAKDIGVPRSTLYRKLKQYKE